MILLHIKFESSLYKTRARNKIDLKNHNLSHCLTAFASAFKYYSVFPLCANEYVFLSYFLFLTFQAEVDQKA